MTVTQMLRKDHEILRTKLDFLEGVLQVAPSAPLVLRNICHSLTRLFDEHVRREEDTLRPFMYRIEPVMREWELRGHAAQHAVLHDLNSLLLLGIKVSTSMVVERLARLIGELREHMATEEKIIFPIIDRAAEEAEPVHEPLSPMIAPGMSANAVMRAFPATADVFKRHGIECGCEGCECLDELAWRRGLDAGALIEELKAAAGDGAAVGVGTERR